jgi:hypothetical protein
MSTTMGPGILVDPARTRNLSEEGDQTEAQQSNPTQPAKTPEPAAAAE